MPRELVARRLAMENGPELLARNPAPAFDGAYSLYAQDGSAAAAAFLCRCAKKKEYRDRLNELMAPDHAPIRRGLRGSSPKLRKNSAHLAGLLGLTEDCPYIIEALKSEDTRYARPAMLLALGALKGGDAEAFLKSYKVPAAEGAEQLTHKRAEESALAAALREFLTFEKHEFTKLPHPVEAVLITPDRLSGSAQQELEKAGYRVAAVHRADVHVHTDDLAGLFRVRSFTEILIEISNNSGQAPRTLGLKAKIFMEKLLPACHTGKPPFGYRIELRGEVEDRAGTARNIASVIDGDILANSPSNYDVELRIHFHTNGSAAMYLRLYTLPDSRFDYRLRALPASMHPATAAAILRYAALFIGSPDARVLDPCCGSGTFLIEREKLSPCASLTGVDIAHAAIDIARDNARAAGSSAKFIANDCLRFEAERPYDELIANLPFGNRVGSHSENVALYSGILDRLPRWLRRDGVAVLYSMEYTLLKKLLRDRPHLRLITEIRTEAGGLMPAVFVVKVR